MADKTPEWLDSNFLAKCLQSEETEEKSISITSFKVTPAVPPGCNFGSTLYRVKLEFQEEDKDEHRSLSLIIKAPVENEAFKEMFINVLPCEPVFYRKYMKEANGMLKQPFIPKSFPSPLPSVVVLEDLKEQGYMMADRIKQLDFDHCRLYMGAVATFHAASVAFYKHNPELIQEMGTEKVFVGGMKSSDATKSIIIRGLECMADRVLKDLGDEKTHNILKGLLAIMWEMVVEAYKPSETFDVLNQGDSWITNMMFKYDEKGEVSNIKLLDFQCLRYASPASDLVYFIWTSANHDVRKNRLDELYRIYLETLNSNLTEFGVDTITYDKFIEEVKRLSPLAIGLAGAILPALLNPSTLDIHDLYSQVLGDSDSDGSAFDKFYDKSYCETYLPQVVEDLTVTGVLEYMEKKLMIHVGNADGNM